MNSNLKQLENIQLACLSLSLFYLFLTSEIHFLKWDILRPRCHKRFTQCPLCNSCKTQTKLLLTPHAVPPLTKWNPRTTFGFWPITLEGDGDWKQYYESRSVIKSLLLGHRLGWGWRSFVQNNEGFILLLKTAHSLKEPDESWKDKAPANRNCLTSSDLTFAGFHDECFTCRGVGGGCRICNGINISEMWHPKPRSDGVSFPAGETRKMICWGAQGSERALKTGGTTSTAACLQGIFVDIQENSEKQNLSLQQKASTTYGGVQWGD